MRNFVTVNSILWIIVVAVNGRDPRVDEPVRKIVQGYGYSFQAHEVVTADDYLLGVHRIPEDRRGVGLPPVLLMHGLLGASTDWVLSGPNRSLAFLLSDYGFDVWMPNNRGTTYSKGHKTLSSSSSKYWDFSWHEMGIYDAPAVIDYILSVTNHTKLFYIGFSQGCTQFYVMASMRPEYNDKVILMTSLAPAAYTSYMTGILKPLSVFTTIGQIVPSEWTFYFEFLPSSPYFHTITDYACRENAIELFLCELTISLIGGFTQDMDKEHLTEILRNTPAGCSSKQLIHYGMGAISGHFRQYDYGLLTNLRMYRSSVPPDYDLSKVRTAVSIYNSLHDTLADIVDIAKLASQLPNVITLHTIKKTQMNHFDFMYAKNIRKLAYSKILNQLLYYANKI